MAGNIVAQAIVDGDDSWRLFAPFELVWAGGKLGRAATQVYYWWFDARERFAARQARQREEEYRRGSELAALRAGEEQAHVEARLGAVVPRGVLPESRPWPNSPPTPSPPARSPLRRWNSATPESNLQLPVASRGRDAPEASVLDNDEQQDWPPADGAGRRRR